VSQQSLAYIVTEEGTLIQLKANSVLQNFKSYNVLLFYALESKNLYNWVGKKAKSSIITHIDDAENLILSMHPDMTVLRHITINEKNKHDLPAFLEDIGISINDYKERLQLWREFEISIYSNIQKLSIEENNNRMLNKIDLAIEASSKILDLAKKIHDSDLVEEKRQFIKELTKQLEDKTQKTDTRFEINKLVPKLEKSIQKRNIEDAVTFYTEIILLYKKIEEQPPHAHQLVIDSYEQFFLEWENERIFTI